MGGEGSPATNEMLKTTRPPMPPNAKTVYPMEPKGNGCDSTKEKVSDLRGDTLDLRP